MIDPQQLLARLRDDIARSPALLVDDALLSSPELSRALNVYFGGSFLLGGAQAELTADGLGVRLSGTTPYSRDLTICRLVATLVPSGPDLGVTIQIDPPPPWTLTALFPDAGLPAVDPLTFTSGGLRITSVGPPPSMVFDATLATTSTPALTVLFEGQELTISGPVTDPDLPAMVLETKPTPVRVAGMALGDASVVVQLRDIASTDDVTLLVAAVSVQAVIELAPGVTGTVTSPLAPRGNSVQLVAAFTGVTLDGLGTIDRFVPTNQLLGALPTPLADVVRPALRAVELRELRFDLNLAAVELSRVGVDVRVELAGFDPLWTPSPISVNRLDLRWSVDRTVDPTQTVFEATASVALAPTCPATIVFQSQPDAAYRILISTDEEAHPRIADLVDAWFQGLNIPDTFAIDHVAVSLEPSASRYAFDIAVSSDWVIVDRPVLSLTEIAVTVLHDAVLEPETAGTVSGTFTLDVGTDEADTVEFQLSAASPAEGAGWVFDGHTAPAQQLSVPDLVTAIAARFETTLAVPAALADLTVQDLGARFETGDASRRFTFGCGIGLTVDGRPADLVVSIDLVSGTTGALEGRFSATLRLGGLMFDVILDHRSESTDLVAVLAPNPDYPATLDLRSTVAEVSPAAAAAIPDDLKLSLHAVKFVLVREAGSTEFALGVDLSASFGLASLPVVGHLLPAETITIDQLQLLFSAGDLTAPQAQTVNGILPPSAIPLPAQGLAPGVSATTTIKVGSLSKPIELGLPPAVVPPGAVPSAEAVDWSPRPWAWAIEDGRPLAAELLDPVEAAPSASPSGSTRWFDVQRTAGPFTLGRIGLSYRDNTLYFLLDASLSFAGLDLGFTGLGLGSPLTAWEPRGHLSGISVAFKQGKLTLEGGLLANPSGSDDSVTEEYLGTITIGLGAAQVSGVAAFARVDGHPSFFAFGQVDAKLGGPPAFFITGAMGGFGYEWSLRMPAPQEVSTFPLVAGLTDPAVFGKGKPTPDRVLRVLRGGDKPWVKPELGERWIAGGITFRSFELITGRLLAVVAFGKEEEIALLGVASMTLPQGAASDRAYAFVELQLQVVLRPKEGVFSAMASLTPSSFLFTRDCHLTGGFALGFWFDGSPHAGDFAFTIGGYHPAFVPPSWYPVVPRVGLNWQVSSQVVIKGGAYFALTPTAVMAGGNLEILFQAGGLKAWLTAVTNLLVRWRPFSFDVEIGVSVGVSYQLKLGFTTVTLTAELSANLHLWGPPTGGVAHVNWWIISFTIPFGAPAGSLVDPVLDWAEFKTLLPSVSAGTPAIPGPISDLAGLQAPGQRPLAVVGLAIERGLAETSDDGAWTVRADLVRLRATSAAPITHLTVGALLGLPDGVADTVDVRPMGIAGATSSYTLEVRALDGGPQPDLRTWPAPELLTTALPTSLWGAPLPARQPPPATAQLTGDLLTGFVFSPPPAHEGPTTEPINASVLVDARAADNQPLDPATQADPLRQPEVDAQTVRLIAEHLASERTIAVQDALLAALGAAGAAPPPCGPLVRMAATAGEQFEEAPLRAATPHGETA